MPKIGDFELALKKLLTSLPLWLYCITTIPNAFAVSLGDASQTLMGPAMAAEKFVFAICYTLGVGFIMGALMQYKSHRDNPQQVRLTTPIVYLIVGLVLILLPIITQYTGGAVVLRGRHG